MGLHFVFACSQTDNWYMIRASRQPWRKGLCDLRQPWSCSSDCEAPNRRVSAAI